MNAPIDVVQEGLALRVRENDTLGRLDGKLRFKWLPKSSMEFIGLYMGEYPDLDENEFSLQIPGVSQEAPVILTSASPIDEGWTIRGVLKGQVIKKTGEDADKIVFHLANFPDYTGFPVRNETKHGVEAFRGRLPFESHDLVGLLDVIPEASHLRKEHNRSGGYFISHVGEIRKRNGDPLKESQLKSICNLLHFFFGFCRGAWAGPLFPYGMKKKETVWEPMAGWHTGSIQKVQSWFTTKTPIDARQLFSGFVDRFTDPVWQAPLVNAINWYVEANQSDNINETTIVISQVALEMLAWVFLVDSETQYTAKQFARIPFHQKLRELLSALGIPTAIPRHLNDLNNVAGKGLPNDAPGAFTRIRNCLVHSTAQNRALVASLDGIHFYELAQLGLGFIELIILALCGYDGCFAQRGWRGWKGDDEIPVPWIAKDKSD